MKAAIVRRPGKMPEYGDFEDPRPAPGETLVAVTAAAMSHVVKSRASGTHYSATGSFPFVPGIDGVARLEDGSRAYFALPRAPFGSMAERTVVRSEQCFALPDNLDDVTAAAIAIPGVSSWAAYKERAKLQKGETVLVNGATSTSGRLAVQIAKYLNAGKVIATGRNPTALRSLAALGADVMIPLVDDQAALEQSLKEQFAQGVDVVIDYLWGKSAECLLIAGAKAGPDGRPIRFVQIGSISGENITLPSAVLRSSSIQLSGSGLGSLPFNQLAEAMTGLFQAITPGGLKIATTPVPLSTVEQAWPQDDSTRRTVFTIEASNLHLSKTKSRSIFSRFSAKS